MREADVLREEINELYQHIDTLDIDVVTCIKFWGFKDMYDRITSEVDTETAQYEEKFNKLEFLVRDFNEKAVKFFGAIESLRNFGRLLHFMALPRKHEVMNN